MGQSDAAFHEPHWGHTTGLLRGRLPIDSGDTREVDLLFAVGEVATNGQGRAFFFRDAREMDLALTLDPPTPATLRTRSNWRSVRQFTTVVGRLKRLMAPLHHAPDNGIGWAGRPYFSAGPYAHGVGVAVQRLEHAAGDAAVGAAVPHSQTCARRPFGGACLASVRRDAWRDDGEVSVSLAH